MASIIRYHAPDSSASWSLKWVDGDYKKVSIIDTEPDGGTGIGLSLVSSFLCGRPIKPDHLPTQMKPSRSISKFPDFVNFAGGAIAVSEVFKEVVESLEPNVHQFFPFDVVSNKGELKAQMYIMIVCNRIDAVHSDKSNRVFGGKRWKMREEIWSDPDREKWVGKDKLVLKKAKLQGVHCWVDKHLDISEAPFVSNELKVALECKNLHQVGFREVEEG